MKIIQNEVLQILKDLLVSDEYRRALDREGELGLADDAEAATKHVIIETLVRDLYPELFEGDPTLPDGQALLRTGEKPLEMHLESGTGASFIQLPGLIAEILGSERINFDVPDQTTSSFFIDLFTGGGVYTFVSDINLKPAEGQGDVEMEWHPATESFKITIEFETSGTEIQGDVEANFDGIKAQLFMKPVISRGRILWEWAVRTLVSVTDSDIVRTKIIATEETLKQAVINAESVFIIGGGGSLARDIYLFFANDDDAAEGLADGLAGILASYVEANAQLVGNALLALPMKPVEMLNNSTVNNDFFTAFAQLLMQHPSVAVRSIAGLLADLAEDVPIDPLLQFGARELLLFQLLAGEYNESIREASTGEQMLSNILPLSSTQATAEAFHTIFVETLDAWLGVNPQQVVDVDFFTHLLQNVVTRKFQTYMFDRIEFAHIVNRMVRYTEVDVRLRDENKELALDWENFDSEIVPSQQGVPCMRYQVSLDHIQFTSHLNGFLIEEEQLSDFERANGIKKLDKTYVSVTWEVYSFHEAFGDPLLEEEWIRDENELLPGVQLLKKGTNTLELKALKMGLDGKFSKSLFLEWNTNEQPEISNCMLLITGKVQLANLDLGQFNIKIPMHQGIGLHPRETVILEPGEVDSITTFKSEGFQGSASKNIHAYTIFASLTQQPFASAYQSIAVSAINYVLLLPQDMGGRQKPRISPGTPFFMEGKINGVTFQTSGIQFVSQNQHSATVTRGLTNAFGNGWSQDIIYAEDQVGEHFRIDIIAHVLDPSDLTRVLGSIPATQIINRFSTADQERIAAAGNALESDLQSAVDAGAVLEWGIPVGLPFAEFVLTSEGNEFTAKIRVANKSFVPAKVPPIQRAKDMKIDFLSADVGENADSFEAEIRFFPKVIVNHENDSFTQTYDLGNTRRFDLSDNESVNFPGPPAQVVQVKPVTSELNISCFGKEYDNPRWFDPHDSLGTARITETVPINDGIDGIHLDNSNGPDGDFTLHAKITTTSPPPPPRFRFEDYPSELNYMRSISGAAVTFEYEVAWAQRLILEFKDSATNNQFVRAAIQPEDLSGTITVNPLQTTTYRLLATNVVTERQAPPASEEMRVVI